MTVRIDGTLGDASQTEQARSALPVAHGVKPELVEAYVTVQDWMRNNPDQGVVKAIKATRVSQDLYYRAKRKMEQTSAFSKHDLIRPGAKILEVARKQDQDEEREEELRRERVAAMEKASVKAVDERTLIQCSRCPNVAPRSKGPFGLQVNWSYGGVPSETLCPSCTKIRDDERLAKQEEGNREYRKTHGIPEPTVDRVYPWQTPEGTEERSASPAVDRPPLNAVVDGLSPSRPTISQDESDETPPPEKPTRRRKTAEETFDTVAAAIAEEVEEEDSDTPPTLPEDALKEIMGWLRVLPAQSRKAVINAARVLCAIEEPDQQYPGGAVDIPK